MLSSEWLPKSCEEVQATTEKPTQTLRESASLRATTSPFLQSQGPLMIQLDQYEMRVMSCQSKGRLVSCRPCQKEINRFVRNRKRKQTSRNREDSCGLGAENI